MKKQLIAIVCILLVILAIISAMILNRPEDPSVPVVTDPPVVEVYEKIAVKDVEKISLETVNVNVTVALSDDNNIHIVYKPFTDEEHFQYEFVDKNLSLKIEKVNISGFLVPSDNEMIYLLLPKKSNVEFSFKTESGFVLMDEVNLKNITIISTSGVIAITDVNVEEILQIETVSGMIALRDNSFASLNLLANSSLVSCSIADYESSFKNNFATETGSIVVNGMDVETPYCGVENCEMVEEEKPITNITTKSGNIILKFLVEEDEIE